MCPFEDFFDEDEVEGLRVFQGKKGWRFGEDSVRLAHFFAHVEKSYFQEESHEAIIDIGTGCGIILLLILRDVRFSLAYAVDIDSDMLLLAKKNFIENNVEPMPFVIRSDIRAPCFKPASFDVIISNPPYIPVWEGRISLKEGNYRIAKWEITFDLKSFADISSYLLKPRGRVYMVYPSWRLGEVLSAFFRRGLQPVYIQFFHHSHERPADFFLLSCQKNVRKKLIVLPPAYKER